MGNLFLISGVLGDFRDISKNMIVTLSQCDIIFVEELDVFDFFVKENNYNFSGKIIEIGENNDKYHPLIGAVLSKGGNVGIFESSGIPCFVDPGLDILQYVYTLREKNNIKITYIPGGSAVTAAISLCGFYIDKFSFMHFLSKNVKTEINNSQIPLIYFLEHKEFDTVLDYLNFMEGEETKEAFIGINIAKRMDRGDIILRGSYKNVYQDFIKIHQDFIKHNEIPDIIFVFNK